MPVEAGDQDLLSLVIAGGESATKACVELCSRLSNGPRARRLALASAVARAAHARPTQAALPAWREAVRTLRDLAPKLQLAASSPHRPKRAGAVRDHVATPRNDGARKRASCDGSDAVAAVETYAALYALAVAESRHASDDQRRDAMDIASEALRAVFAIGGAHGRSGGEQLSCDSVKDTVSLHPGHPEVLEGLFAKMELENLAPSLPSPTKAAAASGVTETLAFLDRLIFLGAQAIGWSGILPGPKDSSAIAGVVAAALIARLYDESHPLLDRANLAGKVALPWLRKCTRTNATAYVRKLQVALKSAAKSYSGPPEDTLRVHCFAATLSADCDQYARDMLRAAQGYLSVSARKAGLQEPAENNAKLRLRQETKSASTNIALDSNPAAVELVSDFYFNALSYFLVKFAGDLGSDVPLSTNVITWFEHVIAIAASMPPASNVGSCSSVGEGECLLSSLTRPQLSGRSAMHPTMALPKLIEKCRELVEIRGCSKYRQRWAEWVSVALNNAGIKAFNRCNTRLRRYHPNALLKQCPNEDVYALTKAATYLQLSAEWLVLTFSPLQRISAASRLKPDRDSLQNIGAPLELCARVSKRLSFAAEAYLSCGRLALHEALCTSNEALDISAMCKLRSYKDSQVEAQSGAESGACTDLEAVSAVFVRASTANFVENYSGLIDMLVSMDHPGAAHRCVRQKEWLEKALQALQINAVATRRKGVDRVHPAVYIFHSWILDRSVEHGSKDPSILYAQQRYRFLLNGDEATRQDLKMYEERNNRTDMGLKRLEFSLRRLVKSLGCVRDPWDDLYRTMANLWLATESLDARSLDSSLRQLHNLMKEVLSGSWPPAESQLSSKGAMEYRGVSCNLWNSMWDVVELLEWVGCALILRDMDGFSFDALKLAHETSMRLGTRTVVQLYWYAESCRRLGLTRRCHLMLENPCDDAEDGRLNDRIYEADHVRAAYGRLLNFISKFADAVVVVANRDDPGCLMAHSDAVLRWHGDLDQSLQDSKLALRNIVQELSFDKRRSRSTTLPGIALSEEAATKSANTVKLAGALIDTAANPLDYQGRSRLRRLLELVSCLSQLCEIYGRIDAVEDARYFASKALEVAQALELEGLVVLCRLQLLRLPKPLSGSSEDTFQDFYAEICAWSHCGVNPLFLARLWISQGDLALAHGQSNWTEILGMYGNAMTAIQDATPDLQRRDEIPATSAADASVELRDSCTEHDVLQPLIAQCLLGKARVYAAIGRKEDAREEFVKLQDLNGAGKETRLAGLLELATLDGTTERIGRNSRLWTEIENEVSMTYPNSLGAQLSKKVLRTLGNLETVHGNHARAAELYFRSHGISFARRFALRQFRLERNTVNDKEQTVTDGVIDTVVLGLSLSMDRSEIVLWRFEVGGGSGCGIVRLPIPTAGEQSYDVVFQRLDAICLEMKEMSTGKSAFSTEEKEAWWRQRFDLDRRMYELVNDVESEWLGPARSLMLPVLFDGDKAVLGSVSNPMERVFAAALTHHPSLFVERDIEEMSQLLYGDGIRATDMVDRLKLQFSRSSLPKSRVTRARNRCPVATKSVELMLAIDPALERLPWEALAIFRTSKCGITRLPHASFAISAVGTEPAGGCLARQEETNSLHVDPTKVFYLLNPSGDLEVTQRTFQDMFESTTGWCGYSGSIPELNAADDSLKMLAESDVFVYCGHGAGEAFIPPRSLAKVTKLPVCVLMGCSSGRLQQYSDAAESGGTALEYLLAGAPAVVANLWDVSDRDIDRLTRAFLCHWLGTGKAEGVVSGPEHSLNTMASALALSRTACRLPFLVGAATVIYGRTNIRALKKIK